MAVTTVIFILGALFSVQGSPILDQSGFRDLVIAIDDEVPNDKGSDLIQSIKDLMTATSETMYLASMTRFYIKEVTILTPMSWTIPEIAGEAQHGEVYEHADIKIAKRDSQQGDAPYTHQPGRCGEEGNPVLISDDYLLSLMNSADEMIVKYGPIGNLLTQEFTKYRYGIFEEYGYPGSTENGEDYPSTSTQAYLDRDGRWKTALVNNSCADTKLEGRLLHIEGEKGDSHILEGCEVDNRSGNITSNSCFFAADKQNLAMSSMGSYQYTDLVSLFCDDEYFPHNHDVQNKHNAECTDETKNGDPMSTWTTILKHTDFENGHNQGIYVESTVPMFSVNRAKGAKFVLVLDNSGSMSSCNRIENLKITMKRWVDNLKPSTKVAILKFGSSSQCATGSGTIGKDCYIEISKGNNGYAEKEILNNIIDAMSNDLGGTSMGEALQTAYTIMKDEHDAHRGTPGVVLLVTDGMATGMQIDDPKVWLPFHMDHMRIITLNIGAEIDDHMKTLVTETGGKAFVSADCAGANGAGDAFQYASDTFVPNDVGDKYMKNQTTSKGTYVGAQMLNTCKQSNDGKLCFVHSFTIEKNLNKEVNVEVRMTGSNGTEIDAGAFVKDMSVRRRLTNQTIMVKHPTVDGFELKTSDSFADFHHNGTVDDEYTEEVLDVYLTAKDMPPAVFIKSLMEFTTTAKRNFDGDADADYYISCKHPAVMEVDKEFKIESQVLRGTTPINYATVVARVHVSRESDPGAETPPVYFELRDDGSEEANSGDEHKNDGTYATIISPAQLHIEGGTGISVMCNLVESSGAEWNDNNFFGKKRGLPTQTNSTNLTPYCCGTKDQAWNIPKTNDVTKLLRSSPATGAFLDSSLFLKGADFGPPGRIANLKAVMVGQPDEGLVKLSWTATGDDWGAGTAQSYNLVHSDKRKGLMKSKGITSNSKMLISGSLDPVPAGEKMEVILRLENHHVPGTYLFAITAIDDAAKVSRPSNIARVNFHDGSPVVLDADPHLVHGHGKNDLPFEEKIRRRVKDERVVKRFMAHIEKNKRVVRDAENNVMEKRLSERMVQGGATVDMIMSKIKNDDVLRAIYKSKLL